MPDLPTEYSQLHWKERRAVREEYVRLQGGKCFYCQVDIHGEPADWTTDWIVNPTLFPPGFFDHPIHLQHDHDTDMTEGAVHAYCNALMWQYEGR